MNTQHPHASRSACCVCYVALFVQLNVLQVGQRGGARPPTRATTARPSATSTDPRARSSPPTAWWWRAACPSTTDAEFEYQREYPTGELFAQRHRLLHVQLRQHPAREDAERRARAAPRRSSRSRARRHLRRRSDNTGIVVLTLRADVQQVAADALGGREGSVVVHRPEHRRGARDGQLPRATTRTRWPCTTAKEAERRARLPQRLPGQAAAGQRVPGALHAGLELQGDHHRRSRSRTASPRLDRTLAQRDRSGCHRRPPTRSRTTAARPAAARWSRSSPAAATSRSPRWPSSSGPSGWSPAPRRGASARRSRSTCPARSQQLRSATVERLHRPTAAARHRRLRPGQRRDGAAAHGMVAATVANGGQMMTPLRRRRHPRPRRHGARPHRARRCGRRPSRRPPRPRSTR